MRTSLLLASLLTLASALLCAYVGQTIRSRKVASPRSRAANDAFQLWWFAFAGVTALIGLRSLLGAFDVLDRGLHAGLLFLTIPLLALALYGLVYYFAYLVLGDPRLRGPVLVFHVAFALALFLLIVWMHPLGVAADQWATTVRFEHEPQGWILAAIVVPLVAPALIGAVAYVSLLFRVKDPLARYRIGLVSSAVLFWFGTAGLATALGWSRHDLWPLLARCIALAATLVILLAYRPPRALERRLGGRTRTTPVQERGAT